MKAFINRIIWLAAFAWWTHKTMWPYFCGRLHVFRNAPTWFVRDVASTYERFLAEDEDPELTGYVHQAAKELILRHRIQVMRHNRSSLQDPETTK